MMFADDKPRCLTNTSSNTEFTADELVELSCTIGSSRNWSPKLNWTREHEHAVSFEVATFTFDNSNETINVNSFDLKTSGLRVHMTKELNGHWFKCSVFFESNIALPSNNNKHIPSFTDSCVIGPLIIKSK